nr:hypothetical protein [Tanacetum cinerariifolium]
KFFPNKLKKLEKNKAGLEEVTKGKAAQPRDKIDKDSVTIGHLGELVQKDAKAIWRTLLKKTTFLHTKLTLSVSVDSLSPQEVIMNGDSPVPTRVVEGILQPVDPTTAEQRVKDPLSKDLTSGIRAIWRTLLKKTTFLHTKLTLSVSMDSLSPQEVIMNGDSPIPTRVVEGILQPVALTTTEQRLAWKNELKARDAKTLMEAIEKRFGENTKTKKVQMTLLKQQFENFTGSSSECLDQIHDKLQKLVSQLEIHGVSLSQEDVNLKNLGANGPTSMGIDMSKVECYYCHKKGHFARECRSSMDPRRPGSYDWSYQAEEVSVNFAFMAFSSSSSDNEVPSCSKACSKAYLVYKQNESVFEENIKLLNIEVQLRDTALATLRQKLDKVEKDKDDLKLNDCESWPPSSPYDRFQPSGGYQAVPLPYIGTFMPPKPNLVFNTTPTAVKTNHLAFNVQLSPTKPVQDLSHTTRPSAPIIEDRLSDSETKSKPKVPQFVPSLAQSSKHVKTPRHTTVVAKKGIGKLVLYARVWTI